MLVGRLVERQFDVLYCTWYLGQRGWRRAGAARPKTLGAADRLYRERDRLAPMAAAGRSERYGMDKRLGPGGIVRAVATAERALRNNPALVDLAAVRHERAQEDDGGPKRRHRRADGLFGPGCERL